MKIVKAWEEKGVIIPKPYARHIKVLFAPDKNDVKELQFAQAIIYPGSSTDYHVHDRMEMMYILCGRGVFVCDGKEYPLEAEVAMLAEEGEKHQIKNTGDETLKLIAVFVPGYTAEQNYTRCVNIAIKDAGNENK